MCTVRLVLSSGVRARLVLSSDDRSNVTGCVRVYGLSGDAGVLFDFESAILCNFLFEAVNFEEFVFCS